MARIDTEDIWDSLAESVRAGADRARPHMQGVIRASQAILRDLKASSKDFAETEKRIREKLNSGARRTKGDVV